MFIAFLIMLRETLEAALLVGIIATYLVRTGRSAWLPAMWAGVGLAAVACLAAGIILNAIGAEFPQQQQELFAGIVAVLATGMLLSMLIWMRKAAITMKSDLHRSVDEALNAAKSTGLALAVMAFLAVGREGLESVFFLIATFRQSSGFALPLGAMLGTLMAVLIGFAILKGGLKLDLRRFFRWTGVLIVFVAAGLLAGALKAFHEAGIWNSLQSIVFDYSEQIPSDGVVGVFLKGIFGFNAAPTLGEVLAYFAFLIPVLFYFLSPSKLQRAVQST